MIASIKKFVNPDEALPLLERLIQRPGVFTGSETATFKDADLAAIDRGSLMARQVARRLPAFANIDCFVSFTLGVNVALNPLTYRHGLKSAFVPERLSNLSACRNVDWIAPLDAFSPGEKTLLHFHPFCSDIPTFEKFVVTHHSALEGNDVSVMVSDAPLAATRTVLCEWIDAHPEVSVREFDFASGSTLLLDDVQSGDLHSLVAVLKRGQRLDRFYREFMAGIVTPNGSPSCEDLNFIAALASAWLCKVDIAHALPAMTPECSQIALITRADMMINSEAMHGDTSLSWIQDHLGQARAFTAPLSDPVAELWRAYAIWYCTASYAAGLETFADVSSETMDKLRNREFDWQSIRPRPTYTPSSYDVFYTYDETLAHRLPFHGVEAPAVIVPRPNYARAAFVPINLRQPNGHHARLQSVASHIAYLAAISRHENGPDHNFRWLDVGCGSGNIANSVNFEDAGLTQYEVVGIDLGSRKIANANANAARNRTFLHQDLRTMDADILDQGFDLVTAFEVTEHLRDPAAFFKTCAGASRQFIMFGSPLNEPCTPFSSEEHTFSFSRQGFETMIEHAGFQVFTSNEMRIGSYSKGHDWLTVVGRSPTAPA